LSTANSADERGASGAAVDATGRPPRSCSSLRARHHVRRFRGVLDSYPVQPGGPGRARPPSPRERDQGRRSAQSAAEPSDMTRWPSPLSSEIAGARTGDNVSPRWLGSSALVSLTREDAGSGKAPPHRCGETNL
jgi:hypothetical protein